MSCHGQRGRRADACIGRTPAMGQRLPFRHIASTSGVLQIADDMSVAQLGSLGPDSDSCSAAIRPIISSARSKMDGERGLFRAPPTTGNGLSLWVFLMQHGVEPTNNRQSGPCALGPVAQALLGTASARGNRWVERILSLKETRRLRAVSTYQILVEAMTSLFCGLTASPCLAPGSPHMRCGDHVQAPLCNRY
jgi:hypothetical protein